MIDAAILSKTWPVSIFGEIDSTSLEASRRAAKGDSGPAWIVGKKQTAGRGRLGRKWVSDEGNLYATALLPLKKLDEDVPILALTIGLSVVDTVRALSDGRITPGLKWPNDVRVSGAKVSGILLETGRMANSGMWLSIGIGLNLAHAPRLPGYQTANLNDLTQKSIEPENAIYVLDECIRRRFSQHLHSGREGILKDWLFFSDQIGEACSAHHNGKMIEGEFVGLDQLGQLVLRTATGENITITAGDVELIRESPLAVGN